MMEHRQSKKKESGAQGRKRRKLAAEEVKKSSQVLLTFLKKPQPATSMQSEESPGPSTRFPVAEVGSSAVFSGAEEDVKMAASEGVEMEEDDEISPGEAEPVDKPEPGEPEGVEERSPAVPEVILQHDVGLLPFDKETGRPCIPDALRTQMVQMGFRYFQNSEGPFKPTPPKNHCMPRKWFKVRSGNGQGKEVTRSWIMYSPSKGTAFCFCCLLFSRSEFQSVLERESGFDQWKKYRRIAVHESRRNHRECFVRWKVMENDLAKSTRMIHTDLQTWTEERQKRRDILRRVVECVKTLAFQSLPYGGNRESFQLDYESSVRHFLELVKMLASSDFVMKQYLDHVQSQPDSVSYFSPDFQNEFIRLMASAVRKNILRRIRSAKYYSIMFDSAPDPAHGDRMSEVVRYVKMDARSRKAHVRESFLGFIWTREKDAESLAGEILRRLEEDRLDLKDCRSQCYGNAAMMTGLRSDVQQRITGKNQRALFVHCDNHSLNLVGVQASSQEPKMGTFFATLDALNTFFAHSHEHWARLKEVVPLRLRSQSKTRWSAEAKAVKSVHVYLEDIIELLQEIEDDREETSASMREAKVLISCLLSYDFLTYIGFWDKVLGRIDLVQRRLQNPGTDFHDAAQHLRSLRDYFEAKRDSLVSESIGEGLDLCQKFNVEFERRQRYRKATPGEGARDAGLTATEETEGSMKAALGHLHREMNERFACLDTIDTNFGFLLDTEKLCHGADVQDLEEKCANFGNFYCSDVDGQMLYLDILDIRMILSGPNEPRVSSPEQLLQFIAQFGDASAYFCLTVAIQILLTTAVSIASCEQSLSKLKLIRSYLGSSMGHQRLCDLALLSVEREETEETNFDDVIDRFASQVPLM
ncbi:zinc finger MYM-type protein 1-like [Sphaerodactylus townsendi]|uniref:zinc finger MYM-type protein 1-like n=1 Tax=Sphaerodactylus townsendi TaxID=933632 RepID=UPI002025F3A7|nr:zinc finger MYM-type protein 1-like [Sphaerodactylus townsendi]